VADAEKQLGETVEIYLDGGTSGSHEPSSIVDLTGPVPRLLRAGAIPEDKIRSVCGVLLVDDPDDPDEIGDHPVPEAAPAEETSTAHAREPGE
jgi:hypothetical protein